MKKRINLFTKTKKTSDSVLTSPKITYVGTAIGIVFFIAFIVVSLLQLKAAQEYNALLAQKKALLEYQLENKNSEAQIAYFVNKKGQLISDLKDDARFLPYYNLLNDLISTYQNDGQLQTMVIDKDKQTEFTIQFQQYPPVYQFIKYIESDKFLQNFQQLTLESLSLTAADTSNPNVVNGYILSFKGQFKQLADEPN